MKKWTQAQRQAYADELGTALRRGLKLDQDKDRWDLLPIRAVEVVVKVLTHGAKKYAPNNWMALEDPDNRYFAAAMRHLAARRRGEQIDPDSKLPHLACAATNLLFLLAFEVGDVPKEKRHGSRSAPRNRRR